VLPPEFEILKSDDPSNAAPRALRAVRDESSGRTHYFYSPQDYLKFVTSVSARQVLGEEYGTRYVLLSSEFETSCAVSALLRMRLYMASEYTLLGNFSDSSCLGVLG
jgi:hypothetical protein